MSDKIQRGPVLVTQYKCTGCVYLTVRVSQMPMCSAVSGPESNRQIFNGETPVWCPARPAPEEEV